MSPSPKSSRDLPGTPPRHDKKREMDEAIIEDAGETGDEDRDLEHGDGGTIDIPVKPSDISKAD